MLRFTKENVFYSPVIMQIFKYHAAMHMIILIQAVLNIMNNR